MYIKIQISDSVYSAMLAQGRRVEGSIALVSPTEGNFNVYKRRRPGERSEVRFMRLPHGRATVTEECVRLTLVIDRCEAGILPHRAIDREAQEAAEFVLLQTIEAEGRPSRNS